MRVLRPRIRGRRGRARSGPRENTPGGLVSSCRRPRDWASVRAKPSPNEVFDLAWSIVVREAAGRACPHLDRASPENAPWVMAVEPWLTAAPAFFWGLKFDRWLAFRPWRPRPRDGRP